MPDTGPLPRARSSVSARALLLGVMGLSAAYVLWHLDRGWMPYDDGMLAQTADRLLHGELSHRDFDDVYTGGLTYLNAAAFRLFGATLLSIRIVLFAFFLAWVPTVYFLASRFVRPVAAAGVTLLAVAWSLPNYTAAMPSWYNLFLATFGLAALFRYLEDGRRRWLVVAGTMGGLSFLVKVVGLYYVAGVLLFFVFHAHANARAAARRDEGSGTAYAAFASAALLLFVAALVGIVRHQSHVPEVVHFVMPGALIALLLARNEWTRPAGDSWRRFVELARLVGPFLLGAALPVALFLVPYARSNSLGAFAHGVFVLPMKRFGLASLRELPLSTMVSLVPLLLLVAAAALRGPRMRRWEQGVVALAALALLILSGRSDLLYRLVWFSARDLTPVLAVLGVAVLWRERAVERDAPLLRARTMLLLSATALCSLVQFPYAAPIYLCYVAPLIALTAVALLRYLPPIAPTVPAALLVFYTGFAVFRVNDAPLQAMGLFNASYWPTEPLRLARVGLVLPTDQVAVYRQLIPMLQRRARGGYTWASPDCPEIYYMSGLRNPTRTLYEMFDDTANGTARVLRALDEHGVTAIVVNTLPAMSPRVTDAMSAELAERYPYGTMIGPFQLRWRP